MGTLQDRDEVKARHLWVLEGKIDLPIFFVGLPQETDKSVSLVLDFSGRTGDGFLELRPVDLARVSEAVWWSRTEPVLFQFRASVIASSMLGAWERSHDFLEQMLDRITLLAGTAPRLIQVDLLYAEAQIDDCKHKVGKEIEFTTGGVPCRATTPFANAHITEKLVPSERAKRALRWFRKALGFENVEDRFLGFYFALECISNDIEETENKTHICQNCGKSTGISKAQTDGIKTLIKRHPELPANFFSMLGRTRARLVHGGDPQIQGETLKLEPIVRTLAAEGIAISLGVDPNTISIVDPVIPEILPVLRTVYSEEFDPTLRWGNSVAATLSQLEERGTEPDEQACQGE